MATRRSNGRLTATPACAVLSIATFALAFSAQPAPHSATRQHFLIWVYDESMARAATTSDVFNAIAEPQRREILSLLRTGERAATDLARELGLTQPGTSKHLRVLREVGLVRDRRAGKQRIYRLEAHGLRPIHEWSGGFEQFWTESFDRLDAYVQDLKQTREKE